MIDNHRRLPETWWLVLFAAAAAVDIAAAQTIRNSVPVGFGAVGVVLLSASLVSGRRMTRSAPGLVVLVAAAIANVVLGSITGSGWGTGILLLALVVALPWALGRYLHQQDRLVMLTAHQARLRERSRIAHDMHDTLGHELSLLALRAGALELDSDLGRRHRHSAGEIRAGVASATARLAEIITVLRGDAPAPLAPATGRLDDLLDRAGRAGMTVELGRTEVPPEAEQAVHQVVQEALTNAMKHAPGIPVHIDIGAGSTATTVTVTNPLLPDNQRGPGSRTGLTGLRDSLLRIDGTLRAGVRGRVFEVIAVLPRKGSS
ncbi:sensor histidine kinase [Nocardia sp. NPDC051052]|uniref:sensor histidine kinase n=1 Tax=Nocardia sp. NPDC051052 TaxID=3364322 RepID=UPI0037B40DA8